MGVRLKEAAEWHLLREETLLRHELSYTVIIFGPCVRTDRGEVAEHTPVSFVCQQYFCRTIKSWTITSDERCGTYCRGGPPWPPVVCEQIQEVDGLEFGEHLSKPRAATEGRPYSTFLIICE